ncbi:hypothetical protein [Dyella caseinilytica]|uniref:Uncharacterized protein n=1 Tax=Dyella caseinilytica TaxID=1849581 RepID=A0ABX7GP73_9GAMM|nr:hypothetical protein [Dyella caseinilytica]QRN52187.1 hypothetical protein ISN74_11830 [Dyella caseinilytica]
MNGNVVQIDLLRLFERHILGVKVASLKTAQNASQVIAALLSLMDFIAPRRLK